MLDSTRCKTALRGASVKAKPSQPFYVLLVYISSVGLLSLSSGSLQGDTCAEMHMRDVARAMTSAIMPYMVYFKGSFLDSHPDALCPYTGTELTPTNAVAVTDASITVSKLIHAFLRQQQLQFSDLVLKPLADGSPYYTFTVRHVRRMYAAKGCAVAAVTNPRREGPTKLPGTEDRI
jgi:hypothetical protein